MTFDTWRSGPHLLTGSAATLYTVPSSTKVTVRSVTVCNNDSASRTFSLSIGTDAVGTRLFSSYEIAANDSFTLPVEWNLSAAEFFQGWADTTNLVTLTFNGFTKV